MNEDNKPESESVPKQPSKIIIPDIDFAKVEPPKAKLGKLFITVDIDNNAVKYEWENPILMNKICPEAETNFIVHPFTWIGFFASLKERYNQLGGIIQTSLGGIPKHTKPN